jgi:hypothetical protein
MENFQKPSIIELQNLETELRLRALDGSMQAPPDVRYAETPEEAQKAWERFTVIIYYKRLMRSSSV